MSDWSPKDHVLQQKWTENPFRVQKFAAFQNLELTNLRLWKAYMTLEKECDEQRVEGFHQIEGHELGSSFHDFLQIGWEIGREGKSRVGYAKQEMGFQGWNGFKRERGTWVSCKYRDLIFLPFLFLANFLLCFFGTFFFVQPQTYLTL